MAHDPFVGLIKYSQSPVFTEETLPDSLRQEHRTKAGLWGKLIVTKGALTYLRKNKPAQTISTGETATIFPEERHHVTPKEAVEFHIEFYRENSEVAKA